MNRWEVYETLKSNKKADVVEIENSSAGEVKEGVIEYLLMKEKRAKTEICPQCGCELNGIGQCPQCGFSPC